MGWLLLLISAISIPLMLFNMLGAVVGGVWLAFLGEWGIIGKGLAGMVGGAFLCSFLLLPGMALIFPGMALWAKEGFLPRLIAIPFLLVGHSWTYVAMTAWAFGAFIFLLKGVPISSNALPYALWAYAVATAPWSYLLQKDIQAGNDHGAIAVFFLQIACVALVLGTWLELGWLFVAFWLIMALSLLVGILNTAWMMYYEVRQ